MSATPTPQPITYDAARMIAWIKGWRHSRRASDGQHTTDLHDGVNAWELAHPEESAIRQTQFALAYQVSLSTIAAAIRGAESEPHNEDADEVWENGLEAGRSRITHQIAASVPDPAARAAFLVACGL